MTRRLLEQASCPQGLLIWAALRLTSPRTSAITEPALTSAAPTAAQQLRRRYVLGEIDVMTFEDMLERIFASEVREGYAPWRLGEVEGGSSRIPHE